MKINIQKKYFTSADGRRELHAVAVPMSGGGFSEQLGAVYDSIKELNAEALRPIMVRYFLSDPSNQAREVRALEHECAVSVVGQAPLCGAKVAAWVWLQEDVEVKTDAECGFTEVKHGAYTTLIQASACEPGLQSSTATRAMLNDLALSLEDRGGTLIDNCLRTWLFVRDVDVNYAGAVAGRNELFALNGMTADTHFIASTGINGVHEDSTVSVMMDSLNCLGVKAEQIKFLKAKTHLNPTAEYGVAFERGTAVDFGDRRHVYISGTASINNRGEIVWPGDVARQAERMFENVGVLLSEADCDFSDVCHLIVYLRDIADYSAVNAMIDKQFGGIPHVIVLAPVCRPGWLIEVECMAFKAVETTYEAY